MRKKILFPVIISITLGLVAWAPWLTANRAEQLAVGAFNKSWEAVIDGCGTNCTGCGTVFSQRVPFGIFVRLEFACGLMPEDSPAYHERASAFVSALGTVHGYPEP